jgi:hypothetical protein
MIPSNFRLAVYLPSQDRIYLMQNPLHTEASSSTFEGTLHSDGTIELHETTGFLNLPKGRVFLSFLMALFITIILETLCAFVFFIFLRISQKNLIYIMLVNIVSLPLVWYVFPALIPDIIISIFVGELFAFAAEAIMLQHLIKKLKKNQAWILSFVMNLLSFTVGGIVLIIFNFLYSFIF